MTRKLSVEAEGKTVEEAIKKGLQSLKLPRGKVKIEVLSEEKKAYLVCPELSQRKCVFQ